MKTIGHLTEKGYLNETRVVVYDTVAADTRARMTMDLIAKWGMVAGVPDGEDSSGRSRIRLATPEEIVQRAIDTTNLAFNQMVRDSWIIPIPEPTLPAPKETTKLTNGDT